MNTVPSPPPPGALVPESFLGVDLVPWPADRPGPDLATHAVLDPQTLSADAAARVAVILTDELAANTERTYRHALLLWWAWYGARFGAPLTLPVPIPVVQQFLLDFTAHETGSSDGPTHLGSALPDPVD